MVSCCQVSFLKYYFLSSTFRQNIILLGCADGSVEVGNALYSRIIGRYEDPAQAKSGVLHIKLRSNRMIIGRLNGVIEIIELIFSENVRFCEKCKNYFNIFRQKLQ